MRADVYMIHHLMFTLLGIIITLRAYNFHDIIMEHQIGETTIKIKNNN